MASFSSHDYVALIDDDVIVTVYVKLENENWKEKWSLNTEVYI